MCRSLRATPLPSRDVELSHLSVVSFACFFGPFLHSVKAISVHRAHRLLSESTRILCTLRTRRCAHTSRSRCPPRRKRESQHHVRLAVGDFNGDSKPDYVLANPLTLQTAIWYMNNNVFVSGAFGPTLPP